MVTAAEHRVLVVDDDEAVRTVVRWQLEAAGYAVVEAVDGEQALAALAHAPDLVVLDLGLPQVAGLDVLRAVRDGRTDAPAGLPVIVLSGRNGETDRIVGLDQGADDYLVKPFSPGELAARVRSVLRRAGADGARRRLAAGRVRIDVTSRQVVADEQPVTLTAKEFDLLAFLAGNPHRVFTRAQLLQRVWQSDPGWQGESTVTEHIHRLRHKLEVDPSNPTLLRTVRGVGYQLDPT